MEARCFLLWIWAMCLCLRLRYHIARMPRTPTRAKAPAVPPRMYHVIDSWLRFVRVLRCVGRCCVGAMVSVSCGECRDVGGIKRLERVVVVKN